MTVSINYSQKAHQHWIDVDVPDQKPDEIIEIFLTSAFGDQISKMKLVGSKHRIDISHIKINTLNVKVVTKNATVMKVIKIGESVVK